MIPSPNSGNKDTEKVSSASSQGRITSGIAPGTTALKVLSFIYKHLAQWRDESDRPKVNRERDLNSQLCKFLNVAARKDDVPMFLFHHEEPQGVQHSADMSANPVESNWIEGKQYTKYDAILVVEGKRLPTPGSGREREYVTSATGKAPGGGIQRFKRGLHGAAFAIAGMIAYIQERTCGDWFADVNNWIEELASSSDEWSQKDRLSNFSLSPQARVSRCESEHTRMSETSAPIRLVHLWVEI